MSIRDEINNRLEKELFLLNPLIPSDPVVRTMFVSKDVLSAATPPWPRGRRGDMRAQMRGQLDAFIAGRKFSVAERPRQKPRTTDMARVEPKGADVFDIRCINPNPGIRVFGRFVERDVFVALTWDYRDNMSGRDFDAAVSSFIERWKNIFPKLPLFSGRNLNDYLTNYFAV